MAVTGPTGPDRKTELRIELALFLAAVLVRVAYTLFRDIGDPIPWGTDSESYDVFARAISSGWGWLLHPDAALYRPPVYPLILAFFYAVTGGHPEVVQLFQALVGGVTVLLVYRFGRAWSGQSTALGAAIWLLLSPLQLDFSGKILREVWMVALNFGLVLSIVARDGREWRGLARTALLFTLLAHLDSRYLFHLPFCAGYFALAAANPAAPGGSARWFRIGPAIRAAFIFLGFTLAFSAPWAVRNALVYDQFVLIDPRALGRWGGRAATAVTGDPLSRADLLQAFEQKKEARLDSLSAEERDAYRAGVRPKFGQPHKAWFNFLEFWRIVKIVPEYRPFPDARFASSWSRSHNLSSLLFMGLLLPFFLLGIGRSLGRPDPPALVMLAFLAVHTLLHVLVHSVTRYRLPVEPFYALLAFRALMESRRPGLAPASASPIGRSGGVAP